jgi:cysteine desulfurase
MIKWLFKKKRIYADYASGTPIDARVISAMSLCMTKYSHNPQGLYAESRHAHDALEHTRKDVARVCGVTAKEVVFTSGGTESNLIAILSLYETAVSMIDGVPNILVSEIEHPSVLGVVALLKDRGCSIIKIPVLADGVVDMKFIEEHVNNQTALVIVMSANNEIGTMQPVSRIGRFVKEFRKNHNQSFPYFHTDAVQIANTQSVKLHALHTDSIALSGSKIYGPKGSGVWVTQGVVYKKTWFHGGSQEFGFRPGTHNVASCVGFSCALQNAQEYFSSESKRLFDIRTMMFQKIQQEFPDVVLVGSEKERLPNNLYLHFPDIIAEQLVIELDARGIAVSSQSACSTGDGKPSHVLVSLSRYFENKIQEGVRISIGKHTRHSDGCRIADAVCDAVRKLYTDRNQFLHHEKKI